MLKPKFVDLFAGCGGLSLGLELAGFEPVFVNELNRDAMASYLQNRRAEHGYLSDPSFSCNNVKELVDSARIKALRRDLRIGRGVAVEHGELDLIVGGPPCQGFSGIGHRRSYSVDKEQLPSNHLFQDMAWIVGQLRPKIFLFENVKGLRTAKWTRSGRSGEIWEDVLAAFSGIKGYRPLGEALVLAKDYGVAQNRPRQLLVGVRDDVNIERWSTCPSGIARGYLPAPCASGPDLIDLLGDLVDEAAVNGGSTICYPHSAKTALQKELRTPRDGGGAAKKGDQVTEQEYSHHRDNVVAKFEYMLQHGGKIPDRFKTKKFAQRLLPERWGPQGPTITATSLPDDYVHFSKPRILTVREWARLQGFPDWYQFSGNRTTGGIRRAGNPWEGVFNRELPKYTQIGNAVPVPLARAIGEHFLRVL